ncbi:MAG: hypothetical protein Q8885_01575 [Candidatus Phytoplasma stylosanthis]|nr:hypothetical protein [Candidatus Phytoplasma stylosanthis]
MNKNNEEIEIIPKKLPSIIVRDIVPIPFNDLRLEIGREFSINALKLAEVSQNPYVVILLQKNIFQDLPKISDIEKYGVLAKILASVKIDNEFYKVKLRIKKSN